jgi:hypothetical protein
MTWFTASVLISIKPETYADGPFQVYENMYLVEAATDHDALQKAALLGRKVASISDGLTIDGIPAMRSFIGVRKLVSVSNPYPLDLDGDRPVSGTELTYALYSITDELTASKLANGEEVGVIYLE